MKKILGVIAFCLLNSVVFSESSASVNPQNLTSSISVSINPKKIECVTTARRFCSPYQAPDDCLEHEVDIAEIDISHIAHSLPLEYRNIRRIWKSKVFTDNLDSNLCEQTKALQFSCLGPIKATLKLSSINNYGYIRYTITLEPKLNALKSLLNFKGSSWLVNN